jgi:uncharacterized membrane protein
MQEAAVRVGYAMTMGGEPGLDAQVDALTKAGCARIYTDTLASASEERPGLKAAVESTGAGDTLVVWRLDRLGQSQRRLIDVIATLQDRSTSFLSLSEAIEVSPGEGALTVRNFGALAEFAHVRERDRTAASTRPARVADARVWRRRGALALGALVCVAILYVLCYSLVPGYDRYTGRVVSTHVIGTSASGTDASVTVVVTSGDLTGRQYTLRQTFPTGFTLAAYQVGDSVLLGYQPSTRTVFLDNYDRRGVTFVLLLVFFTLIVAVARRQGILSLAGMAASLFIILAFVVPNILHGGDPLVYASLAALIIIPVTYLLAHGPHRKTVVAIVSTFAALAVTFVLAAVFASLLRVPSILSADTGALYFTDSGQWINAQSLYLAALLIGSLAVLNDITISQASIVTSLARSNPALGLRELFTHAMDVGRDHVASLVNTLVLVYVGASFTLFLTYVRGMSIGSFGISDPDVSADLLRIVVASIGVVIAVPISTAIAAYLTVRKRL